MQLSTAMRLFVAVWPPDEVRRSILDWRAQLAWPPGVALVAPERLHLTLHFLGNVPRAAVDALLPALARVQPQPFALELAQGELWPGGIAVLRPKQDPPALQQLHRAIGAVLVAQGLPVEDRPWRTHVTLARKAQGTAMQSPQPVIAWRADGFALVESRPHGGGYVPLRQYA